MDSTDPAYHKPIPVAIERSHGVTISTTASPADVDRWRSTRQIATEHDGFRYVIPFDAVEAIIY